MDGEQGRHSKGEGRRELRRQRGVYKTSQATRRTLVFLLRTVVSMGGL